MMRFLLGGCLMILVCGAAAPGADPAAATAGAVRQADLDFARRAREAGPAQAFREFIDSDEGLAFGGPKPTKGADAIFKALGGTQPPKFRLDWVPTSAWGSRGGDMGVTVGDWARTKPGEAKPEATGRYVTVWRRDAHGAWKGLIDIGEDDAHPVANAATRGAPPAGAPAH